ncbi:hypothetical protein ACLKA7_002946 [Drosophila subpalustris]
MTHKSGNDERIQWSLIARTQCVACEGEIAEPGWIVIQRRTNDNLDFNRGWKEYENGFGNISGSFFIGLKKLHNLTSMMPHELYIHLESLSGEIRYANYNHFEIGNGSTNYKLISLGLYNGTAGDAFNDALYNEFMVNWNIYFFGDSTNLNTGWWISYDQSGIGSNLNAAHSHWQPWPTSFRSVQMMIRPNLKSVPSKYKLKKTGLEALPKSCPESISVDGIYEIEVPNIGPLPVYCESSWTLIQRKCCDLSFDRKWNEYKAGFGSISDEFFIGLENLHQMTSSQPYELFIQLRDHSENVRFAQYDHFLIGNETEGYELKSLGRYSGTIGDILRNSRNRKFSTSDNNKSWFSTEGGWWLDSWNSGNLNGKRTKIWVEDLRNYFVVKASKMWIRPKVNPSN